MYIKPQYATPQLYDKLFISILHKKPCTIVCNEAFAFEGCVHSAVQL